MKKSEFYAVFVENTESGNLWIPNIFDNEDFAIAEQRRLIEKYSLKGFLHHYKIYVQIISGVKNVTMFSDVTLLRGCEQVAECLYLADYSIKKHGINKRNALKFKHWFSIAQKLARKGAQHLDLINEL